jgi:uncharacterized protein (TIGR04255 family)
LAKPAEVERLGVRFINLITPVDRGGLASLLTFPPQPPEGSGLSIAEFMHQTRYEVPGHPYNLNVIQALQPPNSSTEAFGLIVDIDVFTTRPVAVDHEALQSRLDEMRWIKNKAFFTLLADGALSRFEEQT